MPALVGSTTGWKIHTSRSDDGKGQWRNSGTLKTLQKFATVLASIRNHFNHERHLNGSNIF